MSFGKLGRKIILIQEIGVNVKNIKNFHQNFPLWTAYTILIVAESRDTTTVFREEDPLCAALDEFCYALNFWYGSMNNPWQREDREYRKKLAQAVKAGLKRVLRDEDKLSD